MAVAALLGKFEWEVKELPTDEFARWLAYMKLTRRKGGGSEA